MVSADKVVPGTLQAKAAEFNSAAFFDTLEAFDNVKEKYKNLRQVNARRRFSEKQCSTALEIEVCAQASSLRADIGALKNC